MSPASARRFLFLFAMILLCGVSLGLLAGGSPVAAVTVATVSVLCAVGVIL